MSSSRSDTVGKNEITPVKQFAAVLYHPEVDLERVYEMMEGVFSPIDYKGEYFPFVESDYYASEMGEGLLRGIVSFRNLVGPGELAAAKIRARELEDTLRQEGGRTVNIDIGYLDMFKVVLASFKGRSNKIYLSDEVWADWIMYFESGEFKTFFWSFPDFKSGIYDNSLKDIRSNYKIQLRK